MAHDAKACAEQVVEKGGFAGGLRSKDGYEMVVEARLDYVFKLEVLR